MKGINWIQKGDKYTLDLLYGRAIITKGSARDTEYELVGGTDSGQYSGRLEHLDGRVSETEPEFSDYESVEASLLFGIVMGLDQLQDDDAGIKRLIDTLDYCRQLLPVDVHLTHIKRLKFIEKILRA